MKFNYEALKQFNCEFDRSHGAPTMVKKTSNVDSLLKASLRTDPSDKGSHCFIAVDEKVAGVLIYDEGGEPGQPKATTVSQLKVTSAGDLAGHQGFTLRAEMLEPVRLNNDQLKACVITVVSEADIKSTGLDDIKYIDVDLCQGSGIKYTDTASAEQVFGENLRIPDYIIEHNEAAEDNAKLKAVLALIPITTLIGYGEKLQVLGDPELGEADEANILREHGPMAELWGKACRYNLEVHDGKSIHKAVTGWDWSILSYYNQQPDEWKAKLVDSIVTDTTALKSRSEIANDLRMTIAAKCNQQWGRFIEAHPEAKKVVEEESNRNQSTGGSPASDATAEFLKQVGGNFEKAADKLANSAVNVNDREADSESQMSTKAKYCVILVDNKSTNFAGPLDLHTKKMENDIASQLMKTPTKAVVQERFLNQLEQFMESFRQGDGKSKGVQLAQQHVDLSKLPKEVLAALGTANFNQKAHNFWRPEDFASMAFTIYDLAKANGEEASSKPHRNYKVDDHKAALTLMANLMVLLEFLNRKQKAHYQKKDDAFTMDSREVLVMTTWMTKFLELILNIIAQAPKDWKEIIMDESETAWSEVIMGVSDIQAKLSVAAAAVDLDKEAIVNEGKAPPANLQAFADLQQMGVSLLHRLRESISQNNAQCVAVGGNTSQWCKTLAKKYKAIEPTSSDKGKHDGSTRGESPNKPSKAIEGPQTKKAKRERTSGGLFYSDPSLGSTGVSRPMLRDCKISIDGSEEKEICQSGSTCGMVCTYAPCRFHHVKKQHWLSGKISDADKAKIRNKLVRPAKNLSLVKQIADAEGLTKASGTSGSGKNSKAATAATPPAGEASSKSDSSDTEGASKAKGSQQGEQQQ
jgi:hypothetical protein